MTNETDGVPPDAAALLNDPRVAHVVYKGERFALPRDFIPPEVAPVPGESPYLLFSIPFDSEAPASPGNGVNLPDESFGWENGEGFPGAAETLRFEESGPLPSPPPQLAEYGAWLVASPQVAQLLRRFEPDFIATWPIEVVYEDGGRLDGYVLLDVLRLVDAYDYRRSEVLVEAHERGRYISGLGRQRGLRAGLDRRLHIFRDAFIRRDIFVSHELARALVAAGVGWIKF